LNFSLSWFELEEVEFIEEGYNVTRIHIPKANLVFSFEDLYPYGYSIQHINSTYILIGNVKNRTDLYVDPITFSSGIITVTGYTEGTPCTFWDVWNASNANGWNVVWNHRGNNTQYQFDCRLRIGYGATEGWFADEAVQVKFNGTAISANWQPYIQVYETSHFRLGRLLDATNKLTDRGVSLHIGYVTYAGYIIQTPYAGADIHLFSTTIRSEHSLQYCLIRSADGHPTNIYDCIFDNTYLSGLGTEYFDVKRVNIRVSDRYALYQTGGGTFEDLFIYKSHRAIYFHVSTSVTIRGIVARENNYKGHRGKRKYCFRSNWLLYG